MANGVTMPPMGFGTYRLREGEECRKAVLHALQVGYRLIDTAAMYGNEEDVGWAIRESGIPRKEIFVTTKLWNDDHGYEQALRAFERSEHRLNVEYIDLYLIHWPVMRARDRSWVALERIYRDGRCRAIGVSNYTIKHLEQLSSLAEVMPMVEQIELTPFLQQRDLVDHCRQLGMVLQAYSPLTRAKMFGDKFLVEMSQRLERTPAQILLRWSMQKGFVPLPRSSRPERIEENFRIFDFQLERDDMDRLDSLESNSRVSWDPSGVP
ncbi:MAG: 2,5-diketo-D-gluconate reductase A [Methanomassiliicoccales archaeon PtaU1.Bin124]|nr:MAG: 2,5-diketo-D-gluconate reductase A [Methanomassiliicoccales archaeon PtaU1.Bin124]